MSFPFLGAISLHKDDGFQPRLHNIQAGPAALKAGTRGYVGHHQLAQPVDEPQGRI